MLCSPRSSIQNANLHLCIICDLNHDIFNYWISFISKILFIISFSTIYSLLKSFLDFAFDEKFSDIFLTIPDWHFWYLVRTKTWKISLLTSLTRLLSAHQSHFRMSWLTLERRNGACQIKGLINFHDCMGQRKLRIHSEWNILFMFKFKRKTAGMNQINFYFATT